MGESAIIFTVLLVLVVAVLPMWKYSKMWGGGYKMSIIVGLVIVAHSYTVMFVNKDAADKSAPVKPASASRAGT
jgi:hypothetical protein